MKKFKLITPFKPAGDQKKAIDSLIKGFKSGEKFQTLLGVTGSGKTFTVAKVIEKLNLPTIVISHNKTLAAQLYQELKEFFPENRVEYFISYYDYYIPEAYIPTSNIYIAKETLINKEIDRMRLSATRSIYERRDVIVVASVSCIYGIGDPENYFSLKMSIRKNKIITRKRMLNFLSELRYERTDGTILEPSQFRIRGEIIDIYPPYNDFPVRIEIINDIVEEIYEIDSLTGFTLKKIDNFNLYPTNYFITPEDRLKIAIDRIKEELKTRVEYFNSKGKTEEAQRIQDRTLYDIELLEEMGYCPGIENYSRHLSLRKEGEPPYTLMDYFPDDYLIIIDESHMTIPQLNAMYAGDHSRKKTLVNYGFRLPSALDNRPLRFNEIEERLNKVIFVSATPAEYEIKKSAGRIIEQIIRPTGLIDPEIIVRKTDNYMKDMIKELEETIEKGERILITTLTKRMAEKLSSYLYEQGVKSKYLHSDLNAIERIKIISELRKGVFDVLVGINLLREGLDLPEVSLIIILDADKEGYLRSSTALIQTFGRAARNLNGKVILYADKITKSMKKAIDETNRRRVIQTKYNKKYNITPRTIKKSIKDYFSLTPSPLLKIAEEKITYGSSEEIEEIIERLSNEMKKSAENLEFEKAAKLRDKIRELKKLYLSL
jgi:excinuclease ABC subunit B